MGHRDPRQNQKPGVVGDPPDVAPPRFPAPADEPVPAAQVARRRTPRQTGDRTPLSPDQIFQVLAYRLLVAQIVMLFHQAMEEGFVGGSPRSEERRVGKEGRS